ncbi:MAG: DEAD/DEAH box helicase [Caulobacteraceae bacterium]|nr:DEAD/DEAH box helicase [Caulobacteraceae bacterium]
MPKGARKDALGLIAKVAGGGLVRDLVFLPPNSAIDRRLRVPIAETNEGDIATIEAEVDGHMPGYKNLPYRIRLRDESGFLSVAYFRGQRGDVGAHVAGGSDAFGERHGGVYDGMRQMLHPDHVVDPDQGRSAAASVEPIYPLTQGLAGRTLARTILAALDTVPEAPEWLEPSTVKAHDWPDFRTALEHIHRPTSPEDVLPQSAFRTRLAYDELFARQCALRLRRQHRRKEPGRAVMGDGAWRTRSSSLPFAPTGAQQRSVKEIYADMSEPAPMLRLLQGDVGSGKTLVAALAMARAAEAGLQSAMMAPTDLLARQHGVTLAPLLEAAGISMAVLTGRDKPKDRRAIMEKLASGEIAVVVGTHALFQDEVSFKDLGLIVIDEQHRFGVSDRMRMVAKGYAPHVLVMSATPIPRTLALSIHGDMDISVLDEKPPGRQPIKTVAMPTSRSTRSWRRSVRRRAAG